MMFASLNKRSVEEWKYSENVKTLSPAGQIIFLSTDGIWEACNNNGEMFGKELIYEIIRRHSSHSANEIIEIVMKRLERFQAGAKIEDDITLVVIKFLR